jgi:hypothetical protein
MNEGAPHVDSEAWVSISTDYNRSSMFSRVKAFLNHPGERFRAPARIFWTGFLVRVLYMALAHTWRIRSFQDHFQFGWETGRIARAVATGYGYADPFMGHSGPTTWISPLFTLLLAGIFKVFGVYSTPSAWIILTLNCLFSALTAVAIYEIAARCFDASSPLGTAGGRVALWSAWLWALYPAAMQYSVRWIWDTSLSALLIAWAAVFALRIRGIGEPELEASRGERVASVVQNGGCPSGIHPTHPRKGREDGWGTRSFDAGQDLRRGTTGGTTGNWAIFGLIWGLIGLCNPSLLLCLGASVMWILWGMRSSWRLLTAQAAKATLAAVIFCACLAPWVYRNWVVFHAFIPARGNLGAELYQSTLEVNRGFPWGATLPLVPSDPEFRHYQQLGEARYVKEKSDLAKENIRRHPMWIAKWTVQRVFFFWAGVPHGFEDSFFIEFFRDINYGFLSIGGLLGVCLGVKRRVPGAWLLASMFLFQPVIYYLVTVQARFRHPIEPFICVVTVYLFQSAEPSRRKSSAPAERVLAEA